MSSISFYLLLPSFISFYLFLSPFIFFYLLLSSSISFLSLIEVLLECLEFLVSASDATQPPSSQEACAVADELDEACPYGEEAYLHAPVSDSAVDEDNQREEQKR